MRVSLVLLLLLSDATIKRPNGIQAARRSSFIKLLKQGGDESSLMRALCTYFKSIFNLSDLRAKAARGNALFDNSGVGVIVVDPDKRIVQSNTRFQEMLGYSAEELMGKTVAEITHADDVSLILEGQHAVEAHKIRLHQQEKRYLRKNGQPLWVRVSISMIRASENKSYFGTALVEDISESKAREEKIAQQQIHLFSTAKMAALGEMAGGVAHEINSPLATIKSLLGQLGEIMDEEPLDKALIKKMAATAEHTTDRIAKIIVGLRTFSRDESRDPFQMVKVQHVIDDTLSFCSESLKNRGIRLDIEPFRADLVFRGRPTEMSQVLLNLLNNAADAIADAQDKWIRIRASELKEAIEIRVIDSGGGVPLEIQQKLFQPFFTTKEMGKGTGLGLSVSARIVQNHQGQLMLDAQSPNTCFVIRLPKPERETLGAK